LGRAGVLVFTNSAGKKKNSKNVIRRIDKGEWERNGPSGRVGLTHFFGSVGPRIITPRIKRDAQM